MSRLIRLMGVRALWLVIGLSMGASWSASADPRQETEPAIRTVLDRYVAAVNGLDLDLAESIYSQSKPISFIHPRGHQHGWVDIRDGFYRGAMGYFTTRALELSDVRVRVLNETSAWADFYWTFNAVFPDGEAIATRGRETQVYVKEADGWKIVHVHYSGPATQREREGF